MNPTTITSQPSEQAKHHYDDPPVALTYPEPSPNARPATPAVIAICKHWGRRTDRTCGQWECYLEWGC